MTNEERDRQEHSDMATRRYTKDEAKAIKAEHAEIYGPERAKQYKLTLAQLERENAFHRTALHNFTLIMKS